MFKLDIHIQLIPSETQPQSRTHSQIRNINLPLALKQTFLSHLTKRFFDLGHWHKHSNESDIPLTHCTNFRHHWLGKKALLFDTDNFFSNFTEPIHDLGHWYKPPFDLRNHWLGHKRSTDSDTHLPLKWRGVRRLRSTMSRLDVSSQTTFLGVPCRSGRCITTDFVKLSIFLGHPQKTSWY